MKNRNKVLSVLLAGALVLSTAACGAQQPAEQPSDTTGTDTQTTTENAGDQAAEAASTEEVASGSDAPLVIASDDFSEKFSEFFCASVPDQRVVDMTAVGLLGNDRAGELIYNGIEGETKTYNGTDYFYNGIADCVVTENSDGTVDYEFKLREGVKFSDGEELTADDVIFSYYVYLDPSYDGSSSTYALPIKGLEEYRSGSDTLFNLLVKGGADNTDFTFVTEEQQKQFFEKDLPEAGAKFAQSIADYCTAKGYASDDADVAANDIANGMANWGFGKAEGGKLTSASGVEYDVKGGKAPTAEDFWNEIMLAYDNDIVTASDTEKAEDGAISVFGKNLLRHINTLVEGEQIILLAVVHNNNVELVADLRSTSRDISVSSCKRIKTTREKKRSHPAQSSTLIILREKC